MTYDNNGPIYSTLNGKPNCFYCDSNAPFGIGSSTTSSETCLDQGGWTSYATAQAAGCQGGCPEGYYRITGCSDPSDPGYNPTMMSCGYPSQINCYTYTDSYSGQNCVSYCDNV
jgi:hypothetical protein